MGDKAEKLNEKNVAVAVVGENQRFKIYENEEVTPYLVGIEGEEDSKSEPVPMET